MTSDFVTLSTRRGMDPPRGKIVILNPGERVESDSPAPCSAFMIKKIFGCADGMDRAIRVHCKMSHLCWKIFRLATAPRAPDHAITFTSDDFICLALSNVGPDHEDTQRTILSIPRSKSCSPEEGTAAATGVFNKTEAEMDEDTNEAAAAAATVRRGEAWRPPTSHSAGSSTGATLSASRPSRSRTEARSCNRSPSGLV